MAEPPIEILKAIAHPLRYAILTALRGRELNVGEIEAATGISQPTLSQQLAVLRAAGLVTTRRKAKLIFYKLEGSALAVALDGVAALTGAAQAGDEADQAATNGRAKKVGGLTGVAVFAQVEH